MATNPSHDTPDSLTLERPEQLKALGHPLRLKVLQVLSESDSPLTNRELAGRLNVDPGHLHFHVRMLHRAGLIELARTGSGREKPYRAVAKHLKVGTEIRAAGLASELQAAQLTELARGFEEFAASGDFRSAQVHVKLSPNTIRDTLNAVIDRLTALEDDAEPPHTITLAFHPTIPDGTAD